LVVQGESGMGKTTVLESAERMATGFRSLWVRGVESELVLAHAGLLQALGPLRDGLAEIPGAQATALSVAFGWGPAAGASERFLVGAAVLSLIAAESERTPVLVARRSGWVLRRCPTRCRWATASGWCTPSSSLACPHRPDVRRC
jgi:hypothetical protein